MWEHTCIYFRIGYITRIRDLLILYLFVDLHTHLYLNCQIIVFEGYHIICKY